MREIKFRGKRVDTDRWVYGEYIRCPLTVENFGAGFISTPDGKPIHCISQSGVLFQVIPETICQSTGLKDVMGTEIYKNDILQNQGDRIFRVEWVYLGVKFRERIKNKWNECPIEYIGDIQLTRIIGNEFE